MSIQIQQCKATEGWAWINQALQFFKNRPGEAFFLGNTYLLVLIVASLVPVVGVLFFFVISPAIKAGVMLSTYNALKGNKIGPRSLFEPLFSSNKKTRKTLLVLGLVYTAYFILLSVLIHFLLGDTPAIPTTLNTENPEENQAFINYMFSFFAIFLVAYIPVLLAFWFAPALVLWHNMSAFKAIFASCVAVWRNATAFSIYSLAWGLLCTCAVVASNFIMAILGLPLTISGALLILTFAMIMAVSLQTFYPSYKAIFITKETNQTPNENTV